ncbi:MAG: hypothetical protein PHS54_00360 [Clostridia bacterium]|nr:hypothetical protein [Clostridia bacterium]
MIKKPITRCMFCNSTSYGSGCPYSPHKKHVHITNGQNCIYCGSSSIGAGCPHNPFSKNHVRGVEYNNMTKESIHQSVIAALFLERLVQPINEMPAFKMGLIDEQGRKIKQIQTIDEDASLKPIDQYILKIRRLIGEHVINLFKSNILLEIANKSDAFNVEKYQKEVAIASQISHIVDDLDKIFVEGVEQGFSRSHIENILIESILKKYEDQQN